MRHERLAQLLAQRSYREAKPGEPDFVLASGKLSRYYVECQRTTTYAEALPLIGAAFYELLGSDVVAIGGLTRGADPIAEAIAYYSTTGQERIINAFSVRKEAKSHGTRRWVEGSVRSGQHVALVDDVVTKGGSVIKAFERCQDEGILVDQIIVLVDRQEGGIKAIQAVVGGIPVDRIFTREELRELHLAQRSAPAPSVDTRDPITA